MLQENLWENLQARNLGACEGSFLSCHWENRSYAKKAEFSFKAYITYFTLSNIDFFIQTAIQHKLPQRKDGEWADLKGKRSTAFFTKYPQLSREKVHVTTLRIGAFYCFHNCNLFVSFPNLLDRPMEHFPRCSSVHNAVLSSVSEHTPSAECSYVKASYAAVRVKKVQRNWWHFTLVCWPGAVKRSKPPLLMLNWMETESNISLRLFLC